MADDATCGHNSYWRGVYGTCMACRAERAEAALRAWAQGDVVMADDARAMLGALTHDVVLMSNWRPGDPLGGAALGRIDAIADALRALEAERDELRDRLDDKHKLYVSERQALAETLDKRDALAARVRAVHEGANTGWTLARYHEELGAALAPASPRTP